MQRDCSGGMKDPLSELRQRRDDLIARLIRGAQLVADAEERGDLDEADRLAAHWRRLALEFAHVQRQVLAARRGRNNGTDDRY